MRKFLSLLWVTIILFSFVSCNVSDGKDDLNQPITNDDDDNETIDVSSFAGTPNLDITVDIEKEDKSHLFDCVAIVKNNTGKTITELKLYLVKCYDNQSPLESWQYCDRLTIKDLHSGMTDRSRWVLGTTTEGASAYKVYLAYVKYGDGTTWGLENIDHKTVVTRNEEVDVCVYDSSTTTTAQNFMVTYSAQIISNSHVGSNWSYGLKVKDTYVPSNSTVTVDVAENRGPRFTIYGSENDDKDDFSQEDITFSKISIGESATLKEQIVIVENNGKYTGHKAYMEFTITITRVKSHNDAAPNGESNNDVSTDNTNKNDINSLKQIVNGVCNDYNNGQTAYNGKLYATINSATSITILHDIPNSLSFSEQSKVEEMENTILRLFSETLNAEFPQYITIYVETSVAYTSKPNNSSGSSDNVNDISTLQSVVEEVCFEYNRGFTPYNGYISATVNSSTSITVKHVITDEIAANEEYVVDDLAEMVIAYFEEAFATEGFPQEIEITVESEYNIAENPQWISADELDSMYDLYVWWKGSEIWIMTNGYSSTTYILTGSPSSSFVENHVYDCICDGTVISIKYVDEILFWYDDLIQAGILEK